MSSDDFFSLPNEGSTNDNHSHPASDNVEEESEYESQVSDSSGSEDSNKDYSAHLSPELVNLIAFENLLWRLPRQPELCDSIISQVGNYDKSYVQGLIYYISRHNIFGYKALADVFSHTLPACITFNKYDPFSCYIFVRGLIKATDFDSTDGPPTYNGLLKPLDYYETPVKPGTLWYFIERDDVSSVRDFFLQQTRGNETFFTFCFPWSPTLFFWVSSFCIYCGSVNVLEYLTSNGLNITAHEVTYAFKGGSPESITFLLRYKDGLLLYSTLSDMSRTCVEYHNNSFFKQFSRHFLREPLLPLCSESYNSDLLLYLHKARGHYINEIDPVTRGSCLFMSEKTHNNILSAYIRSHRGESIQLPLSPRSSPNDSENEDGAAAPENEYEYEYDSPPDEDQDPDYHPQEGDLY